MMFATLDDLEGTVEILVFGKALAACEEALALDSIVLVRGRVDHKDAAQDVPRRAGGRAASSRREEEVEAAREQAAQGRRAGPPPVRLRLDATALPATRASTTSRQLLEQLPGRVRGRARAAARRPAPRRLKLGAELPRRAATPRCTPSSTHLLGAAMLDAAAA